MRINDRNTSVNCEIEDTECFETNLQTLRRQARGGLELIPSELEIHGSFLELGVFHLSEEHLHG